MILLPCPHCGPRNSNEFAYFGEVPVRPDPGRAEPAEWRRYVYEHRNPAGWTTEKWYHRAGCQKYFIAERNTVTNEVSSTRLFGQEGGERS